MLLRLQVHRGSNVYYRLWNADAYLLKGKVVATVNVNWGIGYNKQKGIGGTGERVMGEEGFKNICRTTRVELLYFMVQVHREMYVCNCKLIVSCT